MIIFMTKNGMLLETSFMAKNDMLPNFILLWEVTYSHRFYFVEKIFIFTIILNSMVKNNCSWTYSNNLTTNNFLWKKIFYHKILFFNNKLI